MTNSSLKPTTTACQPLVRARYAGSVEHVFEDEDYAPHGRIFELRVYYDWTDYDPADGPHGEWGPTIEAAEVIAVHYFDEAGNEVLASDHDDVDAWDLIEADYERVLDACREDGYRTGAGESPPWYHPASRVAAPLRHYRIDSASDQPAPGVEIRLSPSIPTRQAQERRQFG